MRSLICCLFICFAFYSFPGCSSRDGDARVSVRIRGLNCMTQGASSGKIKAMGVYPTHTCVEYPGIGVHYGVARIDGLKVRISDVRLWGTSEDAVIGDWSSSPREFEISQGYSGVIEDAGSIPEGTTYYAAYVTFCPDIDLKAWAYLDTDDDGAVDRTVWTTPTGVQMSDDKILDTAGMSDYGYLHYSESGVDSCGNLITPNFEAHEGETHQIELFIDPFQCCFVWDGTPGTNYPFPLRNHLGTINPNYPENQPNFVMMQPVAWAFVDESVCGETYAISDAADMPIGGTDFLTVVFGETTGDPLMGTISSTVLKNQNGLLLSSGARAWPFNKTATNTWTFGHAYWGPGKSGMTFDSDPADYIQYWIQGFQRLNAGASAVSITLENGPAYADSPPADAYRPSARYEAEVIQGQTLPYSGYLKRISRGDEAPGDTASPVAVSDLAASTGSLSDGINLTWTAPGDDGISGTVSSYQVKYSLSPIDENNFDSADTFTQNWQPVAAGQNEARTIHVPVGGQVYYVAIKSQDDALNVSTLSNVVSAAACPDTAAPAPISDWTTRFPPGQLGAIRLTWTATGDNWLKRWASAYIVKYSTTGILNESDFSAASAFAQSWVPLKAGRTEDRLMTGLVPGQWYHVAIKVQDEVPNLSSFVCNPCQACDDITPPGGVTDLRASTGSSPGEVVLTWTATGDDGTSGTASHYVIKFAWAQEALVIFDACLGLCGEGQSMTPKAAGQTESVTITGLYPGTPFFFGLKVEDEWSNSSAVSNIVSATTGQ